MTTQAEPANLHVEDSGGKGPRVLLLHSSGLSGRQWRRLAEELVAKGMRVVVPDLTGHGQSEPWQEPTPFTFRTDVKQVELLLAEGLATSLAVRTVDSSHSKRRSRSRRKYVRDARCFPERRARRLVDRL